MNTFEKKLWEIRALPPFEQAQVMAKYSNTCICPVCPNHNTCAMSRHEWFYCFNGRSFFCIDFERTCICSSCPVAKELGIQQSFFLYPGCRDSTALRKYDMGDKNTLIRK